MNYETVVDLLGPPGPAQDVAALSQELGAPLPRSVAHRTVNVIVKPLAVAFSLLKPRALSFELIYVHSMLA